MSVFTFLLACSKHASWDFCSFSSTAHSFSYQGLSKIMQISLIVILFLFNTALLFKSQLGMCEPILIYFLLTILLNIINDCAFLILPAEFLCSNLVQFWMKIEKKNTKFFVDWLLYFRKIKCLQSNIIQSFIIWKKCQSIYPIVT